MKKYILLLTFNHMILCIHNCGDLQSAVVDTTSAPAEQNT